MPAAYIGCLQQITASCSYTVDPDIFIATDLCKVQSDTHQISRPIKLSVNAKMHKNKHK